MYFVFVLEKIVKFPSSILKKKISAKSKISKAISSGTHSTRSRCRISTSLCQQPTIQRKKLKLVQRKRKQRKPAKGDLCKVFYIDMSLDFSFRGYLWVEMELTTGYHHLLLSDPLNSLRIGLWRNHVDVNAPHKGTQHGQPTHTTDKQNKNKNSFMCFFQVV